MDQNLQEFNRNQNLLEWSRRIEDCRNSGMTVRDWCEANGIALSTYYSRQRKVFAAAINTGAASEMGSKPQFAEVRLPHSEQRQAPAATIRIGDTEADVYPGADEETIRAICRALKSC